MKGLLFFISICLLSNLSFGQTFTALHSNAPGYGYTIYNDRLYFVSHDVLHGDELWVTDGSIAETHLLKDIYPGSESSSPGELTVANGKLFFYAYTPDYGDEIWYSDGTDSGTVLLEDIYTGNFGSLPHDFIDFDDQLFFAASNAEFGNEFWYSDGTVNGTYLLQDINNYPFPDEGSVPEHPTILNNLLFFSANRGLFSDGREPWVTDGTTNGTHLVKDIYPGSSDSNPNNFTPFNNKIYFSAYEATHGFELWVSDGTDSNTTMIKDIRSGSESSDPSCLTVLNNELYFRAQGTTKGIELWKSNGTDSGTVLVKDIRPGGGSSLKLTTEFHLFNNKILFAANDGTHGIEPWITDGTDSGTVLLKDLNPGLGDSSPRVFTDYNGKVFFIANDHLWETNGTDSGTFEIEPPGVTYPYPLANSPRMIVFNGELYFNAIFDSSTLDIWKYNDAIATGINNPQTSDFNFSIYPNPFNETLNIQSTVNLKDRLLTLENLVGQTIYKTELNSLNIQLNLSSTPSGFYVLKIVSGKQSFSQKVIKL